MTVTYCSASYICNSQYFEVGQAKEDRWVELGDSYGLEFFLGQVQSACACAWIASRTAAEATACILLKAAVSASTYLQLLCVYMVRGMCML